MCHVYIEMDYGSLPPGRMPERQSFDCIYIVHLRAPAIRSSPFPVGSSSDIIVDLPETLRRVGRVAGRLIGGGVPCLTKRGVSDVSAN